MSLGRVEQTRAVQDLVVLECDKILSFIFFKSQPNMPVEQLNKQRTDINNRIKDIIAGCSTAGDQPSKQVKKSFETIKKKLSEVLAALKT